MCEMARGQMVRWLAEGNVTKAHGMQKFDQLDYEFSAGESTDDHYVFIKGENTSC